MPSEEELRGRLLDLKMTDTGFHRIVLDNGPVKTMTIHTRSDQLQDLLASDLPAIRAHLLTRARGHFRKK